VIFYAGFLTLLVSTAFDNRDRRSYGFHSGILTATDPAGQFSQISTPEGMFDWTRDHLLPFLYGTHAWDNATLLASRPGGKRVTSSLASYRLGPTRIRQHRMRP
ncbi:polycystin-2, partial [Elysia marginata]